MRQTDAAASATTHPVTDAFESLTITHDQLWLGSAPWQAPLAILPLGGVAAVPGELRLPPCPLIGVGDAAHPLAQLVDVVVEPPVSLEALTCAIVARPLAAAVIVQLLRLLPQLSPESGLAAESQAYALLQGSEEHRQWLAGRGAAGHVPAGRVHAERTGCMVRLTLDNPARGNAIDRTMRDALHEGLMLAAVDDSVRRIMLAGRGRCFSLGAELSEFGTTRDPALAHAIRQQTLPAMMAWRVADRLEAHVHGACVGAGLELAAWAGRVIARRDAWFQLPELAMGVLPGAGGCVSLIRRIGRQRTAAMILSGKRITAGRALEWGLVDELVDDFSADDGELDLG